MTAMVGMAPRKNEDHTLYTKLLDPLPVTIWRMSEMGWEADRQLLDAYVELAVILLPNPSSRPTNCESNFDLQEGIPC